MGIDDIKRLKEKIEKDPNSKLFVPLAEEYKKAGMYDEAIDVLIKGIERQPNYLSARVSLGKIYIEKGMYKEAKEEFEKVTEVIPDNLYAHKKLVEIYKELGDMDKTMYELKKVLEINPSDEWASAMLVSVQSEIYEPKVIQEKLEREEDLEISKEEKLEELEEIKDLEEKSVDTRVYEKQSLEEEIAEEVEEVSTINIKSQETEKEIYEDISDLKEEEEEIEGVGSELRIDESGGFKEVTKKEIEEDLWETLAEEIELREEKKTGELSFDEAQLQEEVIEEEAFSFDEIFKKQDSEEVAAIEEIPEIIETHEEETAIEESLKEDIFSSLKDADELVLKERYLDAMNLYKGLLSQEPENRHVLQRIEELKALLKLLGKDKEALIEKLESFLEGIKKRRDEFYRST